MPGTRWGYCDRSGARAFALEVQHAAVFEGGVARVRWFGDRRWGLVSRTGETVMPARYDHIKAFEQGVAAAVVGGTLEDPRQDGAAAVVRGGTWGLVRNDGTELLAPTLGFVGAASEGLVQAERDKQGGWVDLEGRWVIEPRFGYAGRFVDGLAVASEAGRYGLVGRDGRWVIDPRFDDTEPGREGLARAKTGSRWTLVDRSGRALSEEYDTLTDHSGGLARATRDGKTAILDREGRRVGEAWFDEALDPAGGVAAVRRGERWSFLRPDGTLGGDFFRALAHTEGLARVSDGKAWGFADLAGDLLVPHRYDDAWAMGPAAAPVTRDGRWTWVDRAARELAPPTWVATRPFADGLALALADGLWGFVAPTGEVAIAPSFVNARAFAEGLCPVVRPRVAPAPPVAPKERHVLPEGGLASSVFEGATSADHVVLLAGFGRALDEAERTRLEHTLWLWLDGVQVVTPGSVLTEGRYGLEGNGLRVRIENARAPAAEMATLLADLDAAGIPLAETELALWRMSDRVMGPVAHPAAPRGNAWFPDFPAYWKEVWDFAIAAPASESPMHLKGATSDPDGSIGSLEERGTPLWVPDLRICYGVASFSSATAADTRTDEVGAAVTETLAQRFARFAPPAPAAPAASGGGWAKAGAATWGKAGKSGFGSIAGASPGVPEPFARDGSRGHVERLVVEGRVGFGFALDYGPLLQTHGADRFRYREQEVMDALAAVIARLGLAPVILWQREARPLFGPLSVAQTLLVQLWEK